MEIWVDFNDRENGLVPARLDDPSEARDLFSGMPVLAYDDDGNKCHAFISEVNPQTGWVGLVMKWDSFDPAPPQIAGQGSLIDA